MQCIRRVLSVVAIIARPYVDLVSRCRLFQASRKLPVLCAQGGTTTPRSPVTASDGASFVTAPATLSPVFTSPAGTDPSPVQVPPVFPPLIYLP